PSPSNTTSPRRMPAWVSPCAIRSGCRRRRLPSAGPSPSSPTSPWRTAAWASPCAIRSGCPRRGPPPARPPRPCPPTPPPPALRRAHQLLPQHPQIRVALGQTERMLELDQRLPRVLSGVAQPNSPQERLDLATFCANYRECYHAAARLFTDAFASEPKLAENL